MIDLSKRDQENLKKQKTQVKKDATKNFIKIAGTLLTLALAIVGIKKS